MTLHRDSRDPRDLATVAPHITAEWVSMPVAALQAAAQSREAAL
ncbi:hypothetical protein [Paracoccus tegillarcae]|nr:hypothetical protein [Paracoccus tegillarcae]